MADDPTAVPCELLPGWSPVRYTDTHAILRRPINDEHLCPPRGSEIYGRFDCLHCRRTTSAVSALSAVF